jgi:hypothetical protein
MGSRRDARGADPCRTSVWLKRMALLPLLSIATGSPVSARQGQPTLEAILSPGNTVWITDSSGHEARSRIVGVSGDLLTTATDDGVCRVRTADVTRVRVRHFDSLINGALIGAGAAVAAGLFLCRLTEPWENCRDDFGPMLRIGAAGAALGAGVDAVIRGRRTIYEAAPRSTRLDAAPLVAPRAAGLQVSLSF